MITRNVLSIPDEFTNGSGLLGNSFTVPFINYSCQTETDRLELLLAVEYAGDSQRDLISYLLEPV